MKPNTIATFLAVAGLGLIVAITLLLVFYQVPDKNAQTLNLILGNALGWVTSTFAFFYGNTTGNKTKDETIASQASTIAASGTGTGTTSQPTPQPHVDTKGKTP